MSENLVEVPWVGGTIRELPIGSVVKISDGIIAYVSDGGYQISPAYMTISWNNRVAVELLAPVDPPPAKVTLPTNDGAVVRFANGCVLVRINTVWQPVSNNECFSSAALDELATKGFDVLFEGVED